MAWSFEPTTVNDGEERKKKPVGGVAGVENGSGSGGGSPAPGSIKAGLEVTRKPEEDEAPSGGSETESPVSWEPEINVPDTGGDANVYVNDEGTRDEWTIPEEWQASNYYDSMKPEPVTPEPTVGTKAEEMLSDNTKKPKPETPEVLVYSPDNTGKGGKGAGGTGSGVNTKAELMGEENPIDWSAAWMNGSPMNLVDSSIANAMAAGAGTRQPDPVEQARYAAWQADQIPVNNSIALANAAGAGTRQPDPVEQARRDAFVADNLIFGGAAQPAANGYVDLAPQVVSGPVTSPTNNLSYEEKIENEQLNYERNLADQIRNNGAHTESDGSSPIVNWYQEGKREDPVYNQAYDQAYAEAINRGSGYQSAMETAKKAGEDAVDNFRKISEVSRMTPAEEMRHKPGYSYVPSVGEGAAQPAAAAEQGGDQTSVPPATTNQDRPGAVKELERMEKDNGTTTTGSGASDKRPRNDTGKDYLADTAKKDTGQESRNPDVPEGSLYLKPSYEQGGTVVKAPYRKGGYTEEELMKMGNAAYGKQYGSNVYEGYYKAPDGQYYPVDQIKANYYREKGTYRGFEEGMRDYWNNFGTFYGYRPDWRSAGRNTGGGGGGGYSYSGGGNTTGSKKSSGYSYSGGGGSGGRNYGVGTSVNNGYYWNGNTSWNI